jgi:hypothetical protein
MVMGSESPQEREKQKLAQRFQLGAVVVAVEVDQH